MFDETGAITQMESERYMDEVKMTTWIIKMSDYKMMNNVTVPTTFEVLWRLEKGDLPYARFRVTKIEYDLPEKF